MDKIKIELTLDELHIIMNILSVKSMGGNLEDEDRDWETLRTIFSV